MVEEGEQVRAVLAVSLSQTLAVTVGGCERHDGVERTLETPAVFAPGAWSQVPAASGEHDSAQQQCLHARGEHGVAGLDGVGAVAQLVCQADLPVLGMALLRAVKVRHPKRRPVPVQHVGHHAGAAAWTDDVDHHLVVLEPLHLLSTDAAHRWNLGRLRPVPTGAAIDAHAGFIRANDTGAAEPGKNGGDIGIDLQLAPAERQRRAHPR